MNLDNLFMAWMLILLSYLVLNKDKTQPKRYYVKSQECYFIEEIEEDDLAERVKNAKPC